MKGKRTHYTKKELAGEILERMSALDTTDEEYSNTDLMSDFIELFKEKLNKRNAEVKQVIEKTYEEMECDDSTWNDTIRRVQNHILEELGLDAKDEGGETE